MGGRGAPDRGTPRYDGDAFAGVALSVNVLYVSMCAIDEGSLVSSIAEWLLSLGMAQYTKRFAEDDIDLDVLAELTDQDFEASACLLVIAAGCSRRSGSLQLRPKSRQPPR